ncbi:MAG: hypothetical protein MN733_05230, partial [Nitrososphaera sp.]|nr:hypothetical protein [Nitrososphaera sp.]
RGRLPGDVEREGLQECAGDATLAGRNPGTLRLPADAPVYSTITRYGFLRITLKIELYADDKRPILAMGPISIYVIVSAS